MVNTFPVSLLDVVALTVELPQRHLHAGQVGTIVELLGPDSFEVEFSDDEGRTYAQLPLRRDQILPLHFSNPNEQTSKAPQYN